MDQEKKYKEFLPFEDFKGNLTHLGFANEMMQVINAQNALISKLLQKQNALYEELNKRFSSSGSSSGSVDKQGNGPQVTGYRQLNNKEGNSSGSPQEGDVPEVRNCVKIVARQNNAVHHPPSKREFIEDSNSPYSEASNSSIVELKPHLPKKQTQTKNMVKNFAKAIFGYIRKNREKTIRILTHIGISEQDFMKMVNNLKGHIHSISELRALWTPQGNIYHTAFRIISCDYLRKYCLERTFNSRVENFSIHLKYRQRLLEGLINPQDFTALKTN